MCAPIATAALSLGVGVMQAGMQHSAQEADYAAKSAAWRQNVVNAEAAGRDEQRQIMGNQLQEQAKSSQKMKISMIQEAQKASQVEASAASAGVSGASVENILSDIHGKSLNNQTYIDENAAWTAQDLQNKMKATESTMQSRINSVQRPVEPADTTGVALLGGFAKFGGSLNLGGTA